MLGAKNEVDQEGRGEEGASANRPESKPLYRFYSIDDFSRRAFRSGLIGRNPPGHYFSAERSWTILFLLFFCLGTLFANLPICNYLISEKGWNEFVTYALGFVVFILFFVGAGIQLNRIFYPREWAIKEVYDLTRGKLDSEVEHLEFDKDGDFHDCLLRGDWEMIKESFGEVAPQESVVMKATWFLISAPFKLALFGALLFGVYAAFGRVVSLPLNSILLLIIVWQLSGKR
jgi:hypothetical protein